MNSPYEFDGSHAAPMLLSGDTAKRALVQKQDALADSFEALAHSELDTLTGYEVAQFVAQSIRQRMSQREGQNTQSYRSRRHKYFPRYLQADYSMLETWRATQDAKKGSSSPVQSHIARLAYGMATIEIANLTTIGQARKEFREPMRAGIEELAGHPVDFTENSVYKVAYLGSDTHPQSALRPRALRVGFKSLYSTLVATSELKGRTAAILDVRDRSLYPSDLLQYFQELSHARQPLNEIPEFVSIIHNLVRNSLPTESVLGMNETTYEVDKKMLEAYQAKQARRQELQAGRRKSLRWVMAAYDDHSHYPLGDPRRVAADRFNK